MNQILVTQKLYITPELKRKKKMYKIDFIISIFLIIVLFSYYVYCEYDKNKSEQVSKDILAGIDKDANAIDDTEIKEEDNVLVVVLDDSEQNKEVNVDELVKEAESEENQNVEMHTAPSGDQYYTASIVNIPKLNINYPVLNKTTDELLKISPCKFWGPDANEEGNYCIVGHNYRNKKFFSKVPTLENGDIIEITDLTGRMIKYSVYKKYVVNPEDVSCTSQITNGRKEITLITCTNDSKQRVIVKAAELKN